MQRLSTILTCLLLFVVTTCVMAADPNSLTFTDPEKAGIDFEIQGEYVGEVETDDGTLKVGVQIIAQGDGKFRSVAYPGGLPGDGWTRDKKKFPGTGELKDGQVEFKADDPEAPEDVKAVLKDGKITLSRGDKSVDFNKVERKSPTLGAKPPEGAIVLFDGSNTDAWENGKLVEKNLLGATNVFSKEKFGDHSFHIEFRTPFMPGARGQGRGNSGVYIQSRYECQVLDSFGLEGENNECGGIYQIAKPAVNMCLPPLSWQTYDIDFTAARYDEEGKKVKNARITIKHNGVVIHDDLELPNGTPGRHPEGPEPDSLFMQDHGNPVAFRNVWVVARVSEDN